MAKGKRSVAAKKAVITRKANMANMANMTKQTELEAQVQEQIQEQVQVQEQVQTSDSKRTCMREEIDTLEDPDVKNAVLPIITESEDKLTELPQLPQLPELTLPILRIGRHRHACEITQPLRVDIDLTDEAVLNELASLPSYEAQRKPKFHILKQQRLELEAKMKLYLEQCRKSAIDLASNDNADDDITNEAHDTKSSSSSSSSSSSDSSEEETSDDETDSDDDHHYDD
jgi:hypothetical protein